MTPTKLFLKIFLLFLFVAFVFFMMYNKIDDKLKEYFKKGTK